MKTKHDDSSKHIIWSDIDLDPDDWRDAYEEELENNGLGQGSESGLQEFMVMMNREYLSDERANLDIQLSQPIIVIAELGLWDGPKSGYKMIASGNIKDCLYSDEDYNCWYVDKLGDLRCDAIHHDGTNHYLYRVFKDGVSQSQIDNLQNKIYDGKVTRADITRVTKRLGDAIAAVYGFKIRNPQKT